MLGGPAAGLALTAVRLASRRPQPPCGTMDLARAESILIDLKDDHPYPAMVIDRILLDVQAAHGHAAVNALIDKARLTPRFGIRKVWPT